MRLLLIVAAFLGAAPGAHAATVVGKLDDGRLELRFRAALGERNELRVLPHESGVRFAGSTPIVAGRHCPRASVWGAAMTWPAGTATCRAAGGRTTSG
jgi:hypothetical protein